ncbi:hypothetical protein I4U23_005602 [Adineta vaga]|nr:hypothetical protein I4U23_005602 [Adineta vaga]
MTQFKIVFIIYCCWLLMKCEGNIQCDQYGNDLDILSSFPFTVSLDYKQQGPNKNTAILDSTNSSVVMIQLRQVGSIVPESVFCLKKLKSLDIMNMVFVNNIVPDALSNLQELFSLSIRNTPITKMTEKLSILAKLESLFLEKCSLTHLPNLSGLKKLNSLSLPENQLSNLEGLTNVSSLHLYKNQFTEIPTMEIPEALYRLNMNYNPVIDMSYILLFKNITEIRIAESHIPVIPSHIGLLKKLSFLDLSHTEITRVPRSLLNLPYLQYLVVQRNAIPKEEVDSLKSDLLNKQSKVNLLI